MSQTFFFYDLETSGLSPRADRIMQFAGQRTDLDLNPIGTPTNLLVKLTDDTLPSPHATLVTKITPQSTQSDGLTEADFAAHLMTEIFTPNTIAVGYNNIRFDDEFLRHLFWRTFHDPYEWAWKDGRSRWDLLDVVRLTRALRPEGINWPTDKDGKATNRLELITKLNNISHASAHDALSDVTALIEVARLIKQKQPQLWAYLLGLRDKKAVTKLINLHDKKPFVYASGRYDAAHNKTTIAFPLTTGKNGNIIVYDLRINPEEVINNPQFLSPTASDQAAPPPFCVKELQYNRCPAVAPLGVLEQNNGWQKIALGKPTLQKHLKSLLAPPEFAEKVRTHFESRPDFPPAPDPESALYDGFLENRDRIRTEIIRTADEKKLADLHPDFTDERLTPLLTHYKARNYPKSLTEAEQTEWETYRTTRLKTALPAFMTALQDLAKNPANDPYLLQELHLWAQSIAPISP
jgi:exodeoxyribonuclease-1